MSHRKRKSEKAPAGIRETSSYALSPVSSLRVSGIGEFASGRKWEQNTYEVKEKHECLPNGGVRFNVETLSEPEAGHLKKPTIGREEFLAQMKTQAVDVYKEDEVWDYSRRSAKITPTIRLEAVSKSPENLVFVGSQGFFAACLSAFAQHLPLALSPDHVWALISFAFAQHVEKHAEELRSNFVKHEGKKRLEVEADHMVMSGGEDPDSGTLPEVWEQTIFSSFSQQIKEHIGDKIHNAIAGDFSSTTAASRAAHEITLMSAMKHYFSYGMSTRCGIPSITLLGTEEDWVALRARAEALGPLMTPKFSSVWMPILLPVLDEFVSSYKGQVNHGFWQSMVKLRASFGSGASEVISGWLPILYPYLSNGEVNRNLRPWQEMYFSGPDPENIPPIISSAPVDWDYYGTTYDLHFNAGFTGCTQDPSNGTLTPTMGWFVTHDPPKEPKRRLKDINEEIEALVKGHMDEAGALDLVKNQPHCKKQPWFVRVSILFLEREAIYESFWKKLQEDERAIARERTHTSWYSARQKEDLEEKIRVFESDKAGLESAPKYVTAEGMVRALVAEI